MLRRITALLLILALMLPMTAMAWGCPSCGRSIDDQFAYCPWDGSQKTSWDDDDGVLDWGGSGWGSDYVYGLTIDKLATRSGPSTKFTEPGTFRVQGQYVQIISLAYDNNNVPWVQCEITYAGQPMRVYTGLKRFDTSTFSLGSVRRESVYGYGTHQGRRILKYGPGYNYADMKYTITNGRRVTIISEENGWYQVEYTTSDGPMIRGWVPMGTVN